MKPDCNRCNTPCKGDLDESTCKRYSRFKEGWMLAELALAHPTSLNEALSALPFDVNLDFYLD